MYKDKVDELLFDKTYPDPLYRSNIKPYIKDKERFEHALSVLNYPKGKVIYEIGPYPGTGVYYFGEDNFLLGIGKSNTDFDAKFEACGHKTYNVNFESDDLQNEIINKADIVVAMEVIEHICQPLQFLKKITKLVKPGGQIYLTTNNMSYLGYIIKLIACKSPLDSIKTEDSFYPGHCRYYYENEIEEIFKDEGFNILLSQKINFLPHYSFYNNTFWGFCKNTVIKLAPMRYSSNIEILAIKNL
jgi:SAM-dependent methyltransferase